MSDYLDPYREAIAEFGDSFEVTLYGSTASQEGRFAAIANEVDFDGLSVLDVGCSRGDLGVWLDERGSKYKWYLGIDALQEPMDFALARQIPNSEFALANINEDPPILHNRTFDVVVISGSLNTLHLSDAMKMLEASWAATGDILAFNFLPTTAAEEANDDPPTVRMNTYAVLDWAFGKTWSVVYRQDYFDLGHDGLVVMRRT